jgi:hypothetical protein
MFMNISYTLRQHNDPTLHSGEYTELEFETYLVTVESQIESSSGSTSTNINTNIEKPAFKIPRFKVPSFVEKKKVVEIVREKTNESKNLPLYISLHVYDYIAVYL